jgi:hypothetical protein
MIKKVADLFCMVGLTVFYLVAGIFIFIYSGLKQLLSKE